MASKAPLIETFRSGFFGEQNNRSTLIEFDKKIQWGMRCFEEVVGSSKLRAEEDGIVSYSHFVMLVILDIFSFAKHSIGSNYAYLMKMLLKKGKSHTYE